MSSNQLPATTRSRRLRIRLGCWRVGGILLALLAAAVVTLGVTGLFDSPETVADDGMNLPLATVEQRSLSSQVQVDGTLGYAGDYSVINRAQAISAPSPSDVLAAQQEVASARTQLEEAKAARSESETANTEAIAAAEKAVRSAQEALGQVQDDAWSASSALASAKAALLAEEEAYCHLWSQPASSFCPDADTAPISLEDKEVLEEITASGTPESNTAQADAVLAANSSYRDAHAAKRAADAAVDSARDDLAAARSDLRSAVAEKDAADSAVDSAQAALEAAQAKLAEVSKGSSGGIGTVSGLPAAGDVVEQGDALYWINGYPVILLYGDVPAYRDLAAGTNGATITEPDVQQLNANLVALGYATPEELDPDSDEFTAATEQALKKLQADLSIEETGALKAGYVVFLPSAVRVTSVLATLGAPIELGASVLEATSTTSVVTVALDPARQSQVKQGDAVMTTLPNLETTPGTVTSVGTVATVSSADGQADEGEATIAVEITLTEPAAASGLDQAPVIVSITTATVDDALVVPVTALLALADGGYAVEVVDANGTHTLVPVTLGIIDSAAGLVQVSGTGLEVGHQVVVPGQ